MIIIGGGKLTPTGVACPQVVIIGMMDVMALVIIIAIAMGNDYSVITL